MNKPSNKRTYSREDRSISLAPLGFDEAVTDLLSVPAPPKESKRAKPQEKANPKKPSKG